MTLRPTFVAITLGVAVCMVVMLVLLQRGSLNPSPLTPEEIASTRSSRPAPLPAPPATMPRATIEPRATSRFSRPTVMLLIMGNGSPVAGAGVCSERYPTASVATSATGEAAVAFPSSGDVASMRVRVSATHFEDQEALVTLADVTNSENGGRRVITLDPLVTVKGRIQWDNGAGIGGVRCTAWLMSRNAAARFSTTRAEELSSLRANLAALSQATSDEVGQFSMELPRNQPVQLAFEVPGIITRASPAVIAGADSAIAALEPLRNPIDLGEIVFGAYRVAVVDVRPNGDWTVLNWVLRLPSRAVRRNIRYRPELRGIYQDPRRGQVTVIEVKDRDVSSLEAVLELASLRMPVSVKVVDAATFRIEDAAVVDPPHTGQQPVTLMCDVPRGQRIGALLSGPDGVDRLISGSSPGGIIWLPAGKYGVTSRVTLGSEMAFDVEFTRTSFTVGQGPVAVSLEGASSLVAVRILPIDELGRELRTWRLRSDGGDIEGFIPSHSDGYVRLSPGVAYTLEAPGRARSTVGVELLTPSFERGSVVRIPTVTRR